jgi:hypothetical protein
MKNPNRLDNLLIGSLMAALLAVVVVAIVDSQLGEPALAQARTGQAA